VRRGRLIVMVRLPRAGRVKTRLGRGIGMTGAAWWARHRVRRLIRDLRDPRWQLVLAVTPDAAGLVARDWPVDLPRLGQGRGDLGQRMSRVLKAGPGPGVLVGSDVLGITAAHVARAFRALGGAVCVIGPANDGGFWLVGLRYPARAPKGMFRGVRWSSPETLADTLPTLPGPVAMVDRLRDVDTAADL